MFIIKYKTNYFNMIKKKVFYLMYSPFNINKIENKL